MSKIKPQAWILLIVLSLIWGSSFILMKKGLNAYSPAQMASLRLCIAALALLPVAIRNIRKITRKQLFYVMLFGLVNAGLPAFLFAESETVVSSTTAGILNSLSPIFTFVAGIILFRTAFRLASMVGVVIGFGGACLLVFYGTNAGARPNTAAHPELYAAMIVFATMLYGIASNIVKTHLQQVPGYIVASFSYLILAIPLSIWLFFYSDFTTRLMQPAAAGHAFSAPVTSLFYISLLAVFGSAIAVTLLVKLIQVSNALFGSFVTYLMPIVSIAWGFLDGEGINIVTFISLAVILSGILIANRQRN